MFDMRRQNRRNQADVMTQHEPKSDPRTFPTSSYADHKLDVARRRLTTFFIFLPRRPTAVRVGCCGSLTQ